MSNNNFNPQNLNFKVSRVFWFNYNVCNDYGQGVNVVVNQGGTSSGKTYSLIQLMVMLCLRGQLLRPDAPDDTVQDTAPDEAVQIVLKKDARVPTGNAISVRVVAKHFTSLRNDAMEICEKVCSQLIGAGHKIVHNKSIHVYTFPNGSKIKFVGLDNPEKAKFGKYDYTYICEATSLNYRVYQQLQIRTFQITFIDYNPSNEFWVHKNVVINADGAKAKNVVAFRSTYQHNPFLSKNTIENIESKKNDLSWWRVYGEGRTGKTEGLVYPNWQRCETIPLEAKGLTLGLDFGFSQASTALILVGYFEGAIYAKEFIYKTGLFAEDIATAILRAYVWLDSWGYETIGSGGTVRVIADSSNPQLIRAIKMLGGGKIAIQPTQKGTGSILNGISYLNSQPLYVTKDSLNLQSELMAYSYLTDRQTGLLTNTPQDANNDAADALRYCVEDRTLQYISFKDTIKNRNIAQ